MPPIYIGSNAAGAGKTFCLRAILATLIQRGLKPAGFKPVDVGAMTALANDALTDAELIAQASVLQAHSSLVNPYQLQEDLPPLLAAKRDGLSIKSNTIRDYFNQLKQHHNPILIEGARGLLLPLSADQNELEWMLEWQPKVLWVVDIGEAALSQALLQIDLILQKNLDFMGILLNNHAGCLHGDLLHYQWQRLEEATKQPVWGLLPYLSAHLLSPKNLAQHAQQHIEASFWQQLT